MDFEKQPKPTANNGANRRDFLKNTILFGANILPSKDTIKYEQFVISQINKIKEIIFNKEYSKILSNPYLVQALYYSQTFLEKVLKSKNQIYVSEKIIGSIAQFITPEFRLRAMLFLEKETKDKERLENKDISSKEVAPLKSYKFGTGENHEGAIDLFSKELAPVYSMGSGLVVLAENGWNINDQSSTSSIRGGNTVIVFNYLTREFYRYAHLNKVTVGTGKLIISGENLGTVGHTGRGASARGHGKHLHLEIRKYLSGENRNQVVSTDELKERLKTL